MSPNTKSNDGKQTAQAALQETLNKQIVIDNQQLLLLRRMEASLSQTAKATQQPQAVIGKAFTEPSTFKPLGGSGNTDAISASLNRTVVSLSPLADSAKGLQDAFGEAISKIRQVTDQAPRVSESSPVSAIPKSPELGKAFTEPDAFKPITPVKSDKVEKTDAGLGKAFTEPSTFKPITDTDGFNSALSNLRESITKASESIGSMALVSYGGNQPPTSRSLVASGGFSDDFSPDDYTDAEFEVKPPPRLMLPGPVAPQAIPVEQPQITVPPPIIPFAQVAPPDAEVGPTLHHAEIERRRREKEAAERAAMFPDKSKVPVEEIPAFAHSPQPEPVYPQAIPVDVNPVTPPKVVPDDGLTWRERRDRKPRPVRPGRSDDWTAAGEKLKPGDDVDSDLQRGSEKAKNDLTWRDKRARRPVAGLDDRNAAMEAFKRNTLLTREHMTVTGQSGPGDLSKSTLPTSATDELFPTLQSAKAGVKSSWDLAKKAVKGIPSLKKNAGKALAGAGKLAGKGLYNFAKADVGKLGASGLKLSGKAIARTARLGRSVASRTVKAATSAFNAPAKAITGAMDAGKGIASSIGASPVVAASQAMIESFQNVTRSMGSFVEALSPATMQVFQRTMRDLSAVIGVALLPGMQIATGIVRNFANALLPVTERLQPIVSQIGGSVAQIAGTFTNTFASVLTTLTPVVKIAADVFQGMAPIFQTGIAIFNGFVEVVSVAAKGLLSLFGVDVGDLTKNFKAAMEKLASSVLYASAAVLKFVNATAGNAFIDGVKKALVGDGVEKKNTAGFAAAVSPQISGIVEYSRQVLRSGLLAGPQGEKQADPLEWQKKTVEELQQLRKMSGDSIREAAEAIGLQIANAITQLLREKSREVWNAAQERTSASVSTIGDWTGANWLGDQIGEFLFPTAR